ncbi:MAG TPA: YtfJ family protein [Spirochaetota bacterium]|nr:YtfJ family protein [Spirochaetota bacterium]
MSKILYRTAVLSISMLALLSAELSLPPKLPPVTLSGENGGLTSGKAWSSASIKGKVYALFYVDPDEKDINQEMEQKLDAAAFPPSQFATIAVINMEATWLPNMLIAAMLKRKQEKYPDTIYVKDEHKILVKKWGLQDNSYNVLLFNQKGELLFAQAGTLKSPAIKKLLSLIRQHIE